GIDLFIYGRYYGDTIVLKAIDVESSTIIWANIYKLKELSNETIVIENLAVVVNASIKKDMEILKSSRIKNISFKSIESDFDSKKVIDFLSVAITREGNLSVIDWANLRARLNELKLSMEDFIKREKEDRMGKLRSVDALILGKITLKDENYEASLKMLNIDTGAYEWAGTFRVESTEKKKNQFGEKTNTETINEMVFIPDGEFIMGSNEGGISTSPAFRIAIKSFYIDRVEVSNQKYQDFVRVYKHRAPPSWPGGIIPEERKNKPVVTVNWRDANRYCSKQGKRLPDETEWEKAYRGTEGGQYPWKGDKWAPENTITAESGAEDSGNVDSNTLDISSYGVKFMAGNVREWVSSYLRPYPGSRYYTPGVGTEKVIRGGSWNTSAKQATGWYRNSGNPMNGWKDVGFRCAKSK
ncbi:SUMF1/EgtB/PvdO family nonheme iron enzyme, partial [bacterium]|nr:SUMF1/EgtB/PvdO family nonheme iron enzyme [bacterium]